jgi:hypothetical protein
MATLADYNSIRTAVFVKIDVEEYWNGSGYTRQALTFSDHYTDYTFGGDTYTALGKLLSYTPIKTELRPTSGPMTIVVSGIPNTSIQEITYSRLLSAPVYVYRAFFAVDTGALIDDLEFDNPLQRYVGYLNNYSLNEDWDPVNKTSTNTITLDINSNIDVVSKKTAGRQTNSRSMKRHFPTDTSFDNVYAIQNQPINFGKTQ